MANMQKFKSAGCGHMFKHYERGYELNPDTGEVEFIRYHNQNIDTSRSHLNYNLAPARFNEDGTQMSQLEIMKHRLQDEDVYYRKRKDTNVMCSCCITKPKDLPDEEAERFFKTAYKFLENRYGKDNVISSYVHMDEVTPHMHFSFVPVAYDVKRERFTVSAKMKVSRTDLQTLHPDLTKAMTKEFGRDIGIENGATKEGNLTVKQLKEQQLKAEALEKENTLLRSKIFGLTSQLKILEDNYEHIQSLLNAVKEPYEVVKAYEQIKPFMGHYRASEADKLLQKHLAFEEAQKELKEVKQTLERVRKDKEFMEQGYKEEVARLEERVNELEHKVKQLTPSVQEQLQHNLERSKARGYDKLVEENKLLKREVKVLQRQLGIEPKQREDQVQQL